MSHIIASWAVSLLLLVAFVADRAAAGPPQRHVAKEADARLRRALRSIHHPEAPGRVTRDETARSERRLKLPMNGHLWRGGHQPIGPYDPQVS